MARIFVSYAREDRERIEAEVTALEAAGHTVWWDDALDGGEVWDARIARELKRADCVLLFWSPHSVTSPWVRIEAFDANRRRKLLPVQLEPCAIPPEFLAVQTLVPDGSSPDEIVRSAARFATRRRKRRGVLAGLAIALLLTPVLAISCLWTDACGVPNAADDTRSLAVAPFETVGVVTSGAADFAAQLRQALAATDDFDLPAAARARTLSADVPPAAALGRLGVDALVGGTLTQRGEVLLLELTITTAADGRVEALPALSARSDEDAALLRSATGLIAASLAPRAQGDPQSGNGDFARYLSGMQRLEAAATLEAIDEAISELTASVGANPHFGDAYGGICVAMLQRYQLSSDTDEYAEAGSWCESAVSLDPSDAGAEAALGWLELLADRYDSALVHFDAALGDDPSQLDALIGRAGALQGVGAAGDDVLRAHLDIVERRPDAWRAHNRLALYHLSTGDLERATGRFQMALRLYPDNLSMLHNLGVAQLMKGDFDGATDAWNRVLDLPEPPEERGHTHANLGAVHYLSGDFELASEAAARAVELVPEEYRFWGNYGDALRAAGLDASEAYERAIAIAQGQRAIRGDDAQLLASIASFEAALGAGAAAERLEAAQPPSDDPEFERLAAVTCARLGDSSCARTHVAAALALGYPRHLLAPDPELGAYLDANAERRVLIPTREDDP